MRKCPKCNQLSEKNFCNYCGTKVTEICPSCWKKEGQPNSCPGEKCTDELTQCPECRATFIPEGNSCPCCGEKQVGKLATRTAQPVIVACKINFEPGVDQYDYLRKVLSTV